MIEKKPDILYPQRYWQKPSFMGYTLMSARRQKARTARLKVIIVAMLLVVATFLVGWLMLFHSQSTVEIVCKNLACKNSNYENNYQRSSCLDGIFGRNCVFVG